MWPLGQPSIQNSGFGSSDLYAKADELRNSRPFGTKIGTDD